MNYQNLSVIATQNPSDLSGTSLLPESQLDRFTISFSLDELTEYERIELLKRKNTNQEFNNNFSFEKIKDTNEVLIKDDVIFYIDKISEFIKKIILLYMFHQEVLNKLLIYPKQ